MKANQPICYHAAAVTTSDGQTHRPGVLVAAGGHTLWLGPAAAVPDALAAAAGHVHLPDRLILPELVNAHAHLELSAIGPQPYTGDFVSWVAMLREHWPGEGDPFAKQPDEGWFENAARLGARVSRAGGVMAVGDICRSPRTCAAWRSEGLAGVGFIELFGLGGPWDDQALAKCAEGREGLQPHAPYSAGPRLYDAASRSGRPVCTHLAETLDEAAFVAGAQGPFRRFLESIGKWDDAFAPAYQRGLTPVGWMKPYLEIAPWLVAHCNYVSEEDIAILAATGTSVAYCPIASEYFGHPLAGHRPHAYRDMLAAGVNVCLGTDSIVCQPPDEAQPLSVLPQMRRLYERDGTDPHTLLRMATTHGRRALGLPEADTTFCMTPIDPHDDTDPLKQALTGRHPLEPLRQ